MKMKVSRLLPVTLKPKENGAQQLALEGWRGRRLSWRRALLLRLKMGVKGRKWL